MFSSYVKACHQYPHIVVSFLEASRELIHSCHFVIQMVIPSVIFVMLVTYTANGVRSCSEFKIHITVLDLDDSDDSLRKPVWGLMGKHCRVCYLNFEVLALMFDYKRAKTGADKNTVIHTALARPRPIYNLDSLCGPRSTSSKPPLPDGGK